MCAPDNLDPKQPARRTGGDCYVRTTYGNSQPTPVSQVEHYNVYVARRHGLAANTDFAAHQLVENAHLTLALDRCSQGEYVESVNSILDGKFACRWQHCSMAFEAGVA